MKLKIIQFITLLLLLLVTGVFWGTWFSLSRSIEAFTPSAFLEIGKVIIKNVAWPMRFLMPASLLLMMVHLWIYPVKRSRAFAFYLKSFVLLVTVLLITLIELVPIDNQIKTWTLETMPSDWQQIRDRWELFHTIRTFLCIGGFITYLVPALLLRQEKQNVSDVR